MATNSEIYKRQLHVYMGIDLIKTVDMSIFLASKLIILTSINRTDFKFKRAQWCYIKPPTFVEPLC